VENISQSNQWYAGILETEITETSGLKIILGKELLGVAILKE
jgi:hypothetical protein